MENKNIKEKLLNDKELLRRSVKENSSFSTADLLNIVADLIDYTLNDNNLDNKNISQLQDLIDKYEKEKTLREKKNKHAAELAARKDLSQDEATAVSRTPYFLYFVIFCKPQNQTQTMYVHS